MSGQIVSLAIVALLLAACAHAPPPQPAMQPAMKLKGCDDGGYDGGGRGVLLHGVCL